LEDNLDHTDSPGGVFDIDLEDKDLLQLVRKPLQESEAYWAGKLDAVRKDNMSLWLPNHWENQDVYDYQESYMYQDNRIFTSVETVVSIVNSRIAQPEVTPAQDTIGSLQMAKDLGKVLFAHSQKYQVDDLFRIAVRNLLLKRAGYIKLRWDPKRGKFGDIVPEAVLPEDIVVDQDAEWNQIPRFEAQRIRNKTGDELLALFPDAKQEVYQLLGVTRTNKKGDLVAYKTQLAQKKNIWEVWFQYYDEKDEMYCGGVAWVDENYQVVLGKIKNPNFNYQNNGDEYSVVPEAEEAKGGDVTERDENILDFPEPPFININYLNDGSSYIDLTSMVEQAAPLQRVLDRRGFQIMENSEQAGSGMVFNTQMITKEEIAKLVGAPDEKVGVKGDVRSAFIRIPPPQLPSYVIEDKQDARNEIDNIFATHDITRGEGSGNVTLGQDKMQVGQDVTRMEDIARAVERMATKYYRYLVQMMKVYYTEDHYFKAVGEDGQYDFIVMKGDLIEDGVDVSVQAGSTMPVQKEQQMRWVTDLAKEKLLDPLTIYEVAAGGNLPPPRKMLERFMMYSTDPLTFMNKVREDEFDRQSYLDVQILLGGEIPKQRKEYPPAYFKYIQDFMISGDFMKQPDDIKMLFVEHLKLAQEVAAKQLMMLMTQMPSQTEMDDQNQKTLKQSQLEAEISSGVPGPNQPGTSTTTADKQMSPADKAKQNPVDRAMSQGPATPAPNPSA